MFKKLIRIVKFLYIKLLRTEGTPQKIGLAVAIGLFIGCIIPMGIWGQTILAIAIAVRFRVNAGIAYAATWVSNPYTVIFLYPAFCYVGSIFTGSPISLHEVTNGFSTIIHNFSWSALKGLGGKFVLSYLIGSFIFGVIFAFIGYYVVYFFVKQYRQRKAKRRLKKAKEIYKFYNSN